MAINNIQIRAGRSLVGWSQAQLAAKAGLSLAALNNLERGAASPRRETLSVLQETLENAGVEFLPGSGVRLTDDILDIKQWEGPEIIHRLTDDILVHAQKETGVLTSDIDERKFLALGKEKAVAGVQGLAARKIPERILIREGDMFFISRPECYRWMPKELFGSVPHLIYANKVAVLVWGRPNRVMLIHNKAIATTYRKQFEINWKASKKIVL